jgi:hypothetical protein
MSRPKEKRIIASVDDPRLAWEAVGTPERPGRRTTVSLSPGEQAVNPTGKPGPWFYGPCRVTYTRWYDGVMDASCEAEAGYGAAHPGDKAVARPNPLKAARPPAPEPKAGNAAVQELLDIQARLQATDLLCRELQDVPMALATAIATGRPEMLNMRDRGPADAAAVDKLYEVLGVLIETNGLLQRCNNLIAQLAEQTADNVNGAANAVRRLHEMAAFYPGMLPEEGADDAV